MRIRSIVLSAAVLLALPLAAEVRLPKLFSDHAVLQRDRPVRIWGLASPSETVTVKFHGQSLSASADAYGMWEVWLKPEAAGGPYTLNVSGSATATPLERTDLLVGDVWIASGQSNMEFPLKGFSSAPMKDSAKEVAAANHPQIRLLVQKKRTSATPLTDQESVWSLCTPETATNFSAVAYFFGREINEREHVPIGLIDTTWGGTPAQSWISADGIAYSNLTSVHADGATVAREQGRADAIRAQYAAEDAAAKAAGKPLPQHPRIPGDHQGAWMPSTLFNGMVAPYTKYTIKGALWYQGETDHEGERAANYARVFTTLIQDWRRQWSQGEFPFLYVQIASYNGGEGWGMVRDAQRRTLALGNTGMAVTLDVGLEKNVHPPDKQTVGARLAQTARGMVYGEKIEEASPMFVQATTEGGAMRVWLSHAEGLTSRGTLAGDFEVAGDDHKFVTATSAAIEKVGEHETVLVSAPSVAAPKYVRYGWTPVVTNFLYNASGLPAGTFTSEP